MICFIYLDICNSLQILYPENKISQIGLLAFLWIFCCTWFGNFDSALLHWTTVCMGIALIQHRQWSIVVLSFSLDLTLGTYSRSIDSFVSAKMLVNTIKVTASKRVVGNRQLFGSSVTDAMVSSRLYSFLGCWLAILLARYVYYYNWWPQCSCCCVFPSRGLLTKWDYF